VADGVAHDVLHFALVVAQVGEGLGHRAVDDLEVAAAGQLLELLNLTMAKSGSMPVVSQSMTRPMVPVGAITEAWALR
jgi:hypothetical protein